MELPAAQSAICRRLWKLLSSLTDLNAWKSAFPEWFLDNGINLSHRNILQCLGMGVLLFVSEHWLGVFLGGLATAIVVTERKWRPEELPSPSFFTSLFSRCMPPELFGGLVLVTWQSVPFRPAPDYVVCLALVCVGRLDFRGVLVVRVFDLCCVVFCVVELLGVTGKLQKKFRKAFLEILGSRICRIGVRLLVKSKWQMASHPLIVKTLLIIL